MRKKRFTFRVALCMSAFAMASLHFPAQAEALQISEVMYDPDGTDTGREWLEIWNDGSASVDLASVLLLESDVRHKIAAVPAGGPTVLAAGERAILADKPELFSSDYPEVAPVFDSAFSLSNSGERIALVSATGDEYSAAEWGTGSGATGGRSWQRSGSSWVAAAATPGSANADREIPAPVGATAAPAAISAHSGTGGVTTVQRERRLSADAGRDRVVPVGVELDVEPEVDGVARASFSWSWGDGEASRGKRGRHVYRHPGTYAVVLNVRGAGGAMATARTTVRAVPVQVAVSARSDEDGNRFALIQSESAHELNLGGFTLEIGGGELALPPDTILLPRGEIAVDAGNLKVEGEDPEVVLRRPDGRAVRTFSDA